MWDQANPATDCLWYDISPSGEEACYLHKIPLNSGDGPCFFCKDFKKFDKEEIFGGTDNKGSPV